MYGGIAGMGNSGSTIKLCFNKGNINSGKNNYNDTQAGGIIGCPENMTIENCYNTGNVSGSGNDIGGCVGQAYGSCTIRKFYNSGAISGSRIGSVNGRAGSGGSINGSNCYSTTTLQLSGGSNGGSVSVSGGTNYENNITELITLLGNEFENDDYNLNNGYPVLKWQNDEYKIQNGILN